MNRNFNVVAASSMLRGGEQGTCSGPPFLGAPLRGVLRLNVPYLFVNC